MGFISIPHITSTDVANEDLFNSRFDTIVNLLNGNLDANNLADGAVTTAKVGASAITKAKIDFTGIYGQEIGRVTLVSAATSITVSSLPNFKYLHLEAFVVNGGAGLDLYIRFNGDAATNYAWKHAGNNAAGTAGASAAQLPVNFSNVAVPKYVVANIINVSSKEKMLQGESTETSLAGAANGPNKAEFTGKWANTADAISSISVFDIAGTANAMGAGSEVVIYGHN